MLDQYVVPKGNPITDDNVEEKDIVMNEDGTMYG
jgi:hypothetical protein